MHWRAGLVFFSIQHSEIFDISHAFLPVAKLSTLKEFRFFWPSLYTNYSSFRSHWHRTADVRWSMNFKRWKSYLFMETRLRAMERHLPYGIRQCHLPPETGERAQHHNCTLSIHVSYVFQWLLSLDEGSNCGNALWLNVFYRQCYPTLCCYILAW